MMEALCIRYEMAEECADDDDAKVGINELRKSVVKELKMHDSSGDVSINKTAAACVCFKFLVSCLECFFLINLLQLQMLYPCLYL